MNGSDVLKWMNQSQCITETPVIMISSEISEVVRNSNRVMVMRDGHKLGELTGGEINQEEIMKRIADNRVFSKCGKEAQYE